MSLCDVDLTLGRQYFVKKHLFTKQVKWFLRHEMTKKTISFKNGSSLVKLRDSVKLKYKSLNRRFLTKWCLGLLQQTRIHNGLKTGIKRTPIFGFAIAVKTLSDSIFPCYLQLKHIKWQIFINFIFLSQIHYFIIFWWVYVQFKLQG